MTRIVRWNPVRDMAEMQSALDRLFENTLQTYSANGGHNWLALDVHEDENSYTVKADVPGLTPDNLDITLHENVLTIHAEFNTEKTQEENGRVIVSERRSGSFRRSVTLPVNVDADKVVADYENGVLTLTLPKSEAARPRQIAVKAHNN